MTFAILYRLSFYALLAIGSLILNMDATVDYAHYFPIGMVAACLLAFTLVDRRRSAGLPAGAANLLGICSLFPVYFEYVLDPNQLVLACGHWLFYLTLVKMFRHKTSGDDWYLILLALMQVLVGCFLSQSDRVGLWLVIWAILALWVLSLFYLHREAIDAGLAEVEPRPVGARNEVRRGPYAGLFRLPFLVNTAKSAAMTLLIGVIIFLFMPRTGTPGQSPRGSAGPRSLTGFSEEVRLGQMGEILEGNGVVFTAELRSDSDARLVPDEEAMLWRGVTLSRYRNGRWLRETIRDGGYGAPPTSRPVGSATITQRVHLESTLNHVLFALRPVVEVLRPVDDISLQSTDGTLVRDLGRPSRRRSRGGPLDYTIRSLQDPGEVTVQPGEIDPATNRRIDDLKQIPEELEAPLKAISKRVIAGLPLEDFIEQGHALERYLRDSGEYRYTLRQDRDDRQIDPILDFVQNTKRGHCEYFASTLAMMLRSQGIPSRVVNGFKGGDWNDLAQMITVRQWHAHSWVEAYIGASEGGGGPRWLTLDPTPGSEREVQIELSSEMPRSLRQFVDFVRYVWVFYVAGFNKDRQQQLLYQPIRSLIQEARDGFRIMRLWFVGALRWMTDFPDLSAVFSIRGFVASSTVMLLIVAVVALLRRLWRLYRRFGALAEHSADPSGALAAYVRLVRVLGGYGLRRPANETPREFARRAGVMLADHIRDVEGRPLSDLPARIVEAFYRVRYGEIALPDDLIAHLEAQLDDLETGLKPSRA